MYGILLVLLIGFFNCQLIHGQGQRIAPGVPPQHYQQPIQDQMHQVPHQHVPQQIPQQQFQQQVPVQQVPMQQQHVPVQHHQQQQMHQQPMHQQQVHQQQVHQQQVNQQQVHQQQVHQQVPQGHHHDHPPQQLLNAANIAQEKAHIAEHLEVPMDTSKMSEQELQFHYFKMHDADNNNKLDGCELIKSLIHWHEKGNKEHGEAVAGDKLFTDPELVSLIDPILNMDDTNRDGFIDYPEFMQAQQNAAAGGRH